MSTPKQMEKKYQAIRLYNAGQITLADIKATFRIVSVVADDEYTGNDKHLQVLGTRDRLKKIERLTQTRNAAIQEKILRFKTKPRLTGTRAEEVSAFATDWKGGIPHGWQRYGLLRKKTKRINKPRIGSSNGKIAKPRYKGFKKFNRNFDTLERGLIRLLQVGSKNNSAINAIKKVREQTKVTTTRG